MDYPFEPRSTTHLEPGQFWAIPLSDGRFACGRVLEVPRAPDPLIPVSRRVFLAAVLDWVDTALPTASSIAGADVLAQGFLHVKSIRTSGGVVLGVRALDDDGIEPRLWRTSGYSPQAWVYRGASPVRPATDADGPLPVLGVWGFAVPTAIAEHAFVSR